MSGGYGSFTFTGLNDDPFLQFTIKGYPDHHGVTDQLHKLKPGDEIIIHDVWGAIEYRGNLCLWPGRDGKRIDGYAYRLGRHARSRCLREIVK